MNIKEMERVVRIPQAQEKNNTDYFQHGSEIWAP